MSQARRLHEDIEESKAMAVDILKLAREEKGLEQEVEDAATQFRFLSLETQLNSTLGEILSKLQLIDLTLSQVGHLLGNGELCHAVEILGDADIALGELSNEGGIIVVSLMKEKAQGLKSALVNKAEDCWRDLVVVNTQEKEISICKDAIGKWTLLSWGARKLTENRKFRSFWGDCDRRIEDIGYTKKQSGPVPPPG